MTMCRKSKRADKPQDTLAYGHGRKSGFLGPGAGLAGAVVAALVSSLCCLGPLVYLVFGVSAAGFSGLEKLGWLQWPMIGGSLVLLLAGFWRLYVSRQPYCNAYVSRRVMCMLYWLAVPLVLALLFYPFFLPYVLEWLE